MKQTSSIRSGEAIQFNAGQSGKYLILREASQPVLLRGDTLRPVEIERGDTVDVSQFDELELYNHNRTSVYIEYQITDVEVRIKSSSTAINGALNIHEIESPIVVSKIQQPIDVEVSIPDVEVKMPQNLEVSNLPEVQKVEVTNQPDNNGVSPELYTLKKVGSGKIVLSGTEVTIPKKSDRKALFIQASKGNTQPVLVQGFIDVMPGGHLLIKSNEAIKLEGIAEDNIRIGEFV